jgi:hypothetical protein
MQVVYAAHLDIPAHAAGSGTESAIQAVIAWVKRRFQVRIAPFDDGTATGRNARVHWSSLTSTDRALLSVWVDQGDPHDASWRWLTYLDVGVADGAAWVRVRVQLDAVATERVVVPWLQVGRPGIVRDLVNALDIEQDGYPLAEPIRVSVSDVVGLVDLLLSPERRLPVVVISRREDGDTFLDPDRIADRLLGLAHVAVVDAQATFVLTERLGRDLTCHSGAVRVYWPGLRLTDGPIKHRLFLGAALTFLGADGLENELFSILGHAAGYAIGEPALRRELIRLRRHQQSQGDLAERIAATKASIAQSDGMVPREEFEEFSREFDEMSARVDQLEREAADLEAQNQDLRRERDNDRDQIVELTQQFGASAVSNATTDSAFEPASVLEAVSAVGTLSRYIVLLDTVYESAAKSQYDNPKQVLLDLLTLDAIAWAWSSGNLKVGPHEALQETTAYRDGISPTAAQKYEVDYRRDYGGKSIMLGPHFAHGNGAVTAIMRIYYYFDKQAKTIVVGHVGKKLRDDSNRN